MVIKETRWFLLNFLKLRNPIFQLPPMKSQLLRNRGQMKIQQTAFMLIAVTLFFVLVGIFVLVFMFSGLRQSATLLEEENAMLLVTKLANSPEFACMSSFGSSKLSCVDADKVMMLKEQIDKYSGFWGVAEIKIRKVYPTNGEECDFGNYPNCGVIELYSEDVNKLPAVSNFVSLCWKENSDSGIYAKCELARLMVKSEDKR